MLCFADFWWMAVREILRKKGAEFNSRVWENISGGTADHPQECKECRIKDSQNLGWKGS